jgi:hypothetical protein
MILKQTIPYRKYIFGLSLCILLGFIPEKYSGDFKKEKKEIDTLTIFNAIVYIVSDNNRSEFVDIALSQINQKLLDSVTYNLLSKKYKLEKAFITSIDIKIYNDLFVKLDTSSKSLNKISSKPLFINQKIACKSKYALLLVYQGQYHPDFPPHYKLNKAMLSSTIVIKPNNPTAANSDLRLLIIDTETEEIVFYDRLHTSRFDARVDTEIIQMTRNILRNVYYK